LKHENKIKIEHQTKSSASRRTHESPHIKPKETQMGKQTYALTSGGLYDNGQATLFFWGSHSNDYTHNITLHYITWVNKQIPLFTHG